LFNRELVFGDYTRPFARLFTSKKECKSNHQRGALHKAILHKFERFKLTSLTRTATPPVRYQAYGGVLIFVKVDIREEISKRHSPDSKALYGIGQGLHLSNGETHFNWLFFNQLNLSTGN
jgi:hypothetical protein